MKTEIKRLKVQEKDKIRDIEIKDKYQKNEARD